MQTVIIENLRKIRKSIPKIGRTLRVQISVSGNNVSVSGNELDEFISIKVLKAVDFGFDVEDALVLKNEDYVLEFVGVKAHSRRNNLKEVRARLIGTNGKAKKTIEGLTGAVIVIQSNCIGIIVNSEHLDSAVQGIVSLIQGAKHANVFSYLEKQNVVLRKADDDLGLKEGISSEIDE